MSTDEEADKSSDKPSNYEGSALIIGNRSEGPSKSNTEKLKNDSQHQRSPFLNRFKNWLKEHATPMNFLTLVIAVAAWAQFHATNGQLQTMRDQLSEMRSGSADTHALAVAAQEQASSSKALARNASRQVDELRNLSQATARTANASALQSKTSANQLQAAERPWISVEARIERDLVFLSGTLNVSIHFVVTNTGHSPAMNVFVSPEIYADPAGDMRQRQQETCISDIQNFRSGMAHAGEIIFPNHSEEMGVGLHLGPEAVGSHARQGNLYLTIVGCVTYGSSFDMGIHQTGFLYDLIWDNPHDPRNHVIPINVDIPRSQLRLRKIPMGFGRFAN